MRSIFLIYGKRQEIPRRGIFSVFYGGNFHQLFKEVAEVIGFAVANLISDLIDLHIGVREQVACFFDAHVVDVVRYACADILAEEFSCIVWAESRQLSKVGDLDLFVIALIDIIFHHFYHGRIIGAERCTAADDVQFFSEFCDVSLGNRPAINFGSGVVGDLADAKENVVNE